MTEQLTLLPDFPRQFHAPGTFAATRSYRIGRFRWWLTRRWGNGSPVCWIMLNPSTADASKNDPTLLRCIHFSAMWGYGGLVVVNLYPFRSPKPSDCQRWSQSDDYQPAMMLNFGTIKEKVRESALIIAAWGAGNWDRNVEEDIVVGILIKDQTDSAEPHHPLYCLGKNDDGSPKHPLAQGKHRVPNDQQPIRWA